MGFYQQISKYYDNIFPTSSKPVEMIIQAAGAPPKNILDVACGSGGYSIELAQLGYDITSVDIDEAMVMLAQVKAKKKGLKMDVRLGDMLQLVESIDKRFNCIFCIGNSLVHLGSTEQIGKALGGMNTLLKEKGSLVLQIINYDRIIKYGLDELPAITDSNIGLEFIRKYEYNKETGLISFNTVLSVNNAEASDKYENTIDLFPVASQDMKNLLQCAGYSDIQFYGGFDLSPYNSDAYLLVVKATKQ